MDELHNQVAFLLALLVAALIIGIVAERTKIPYTVALLVASLPLYYAHLQFEFGPWLLLVFLPALIFEAAWNLERPALRRTWPAIAMLAVPGVAFTASVVGFGLYAMHQMALAPALLLGIILSATDPVAVIATFRRLAVPVDLATIVEGESLFNDGAAVVLYGVALTALGLSGGAHAAAGPSNVWAVGAIAVAGAFGGLLIGALIAFAVSQAMRLVDDAMLEIVASIVAAYGAYLLSETVHCSGILAAISSAIALRAFGLSRPKNADAEIGNFWAVAAFIANSLVFLLMGLRIELPRIIHEPWLVVSTLGLLLGARLVLAYAGLPLVRVAGENIKWRHVVAASGLRGAISVALAVSLPDDVPMRPQIVDAVFGAVCVTLVAQGLAIGPIISRLNLRAEAAAAQ
jgi:CPA1 family monovalent cation:H+ antiporter